MTFLDHNLAWCKVTLGSWDGNGAIADCLAPQLDLQPTWVVLELPYLDSKYGNILGPRSLPCILPSHRGLV